MSMTFTSRRTSSANGNSGLWRIRYRMKLRFGNIFHLSCLETDDFLMFVETFSILGNYGEIGRSDTSSPYFKGILYEISKRTIDMKLKVKFNVYKSKNRKLSHQQTILFSSLDGLMEFINEFHVKINNLKD